MLWRAAARMLLAHPLLGVGPDNYRLTYGAYAGVQRADPRVHTNNMYLEIAVGAGLLGAAAFAWLVWATAATCRRALASTTRLTPTAGVVAATAAIAVHGFVDSFLGVTATYVAIAITLGLAAAAASSGDWNADRV